MVSTCSVSKVSQVHHNTCHRKHTFLLHPPIKYSCKLTKTLKMDLLRIISGPRMVDHNRKLSTYVHQQTVGAHKSLSTRLINALMLLTNRTHRIKKYKSVYSVIKSNLILPSIECFPSFK